MTGPFHAEKLGWFCWRVRAEWSHGEYFIADCWTRRGAMSLVKQLNDCFFASSGPTMKLPDGCNRFVLGPRVEYNSVVNVCVADWLV